MTTTGTLVWQTVLAAFQRIPPGTPTKPYRALAAFFICDLFNTKSIYIPVWTAEIEEKGERYTGANGLNQKMTKKVAESLKQSHYIAH